MAAAHVGPHRREAAEELQGALLAPVLGEPREPLLVGRLQPDPTFPLRIEKALVGRRQLVAPHLGGVEGHDEEIEAVGDPHPVGGHAPDGNVGDVRAFEARQYALARQRLDLGGVGFDHVDGVPARPRLAQGASQDLVAERAPQLDLHAVFLFERLGEGNRFGGRERGIDDQRPFLARAGGEALRPVGPAVEIHGRVFFRRLGARRGNAGRGQNQDGESDHRNPRSTLPVII